MDTFKFWLGINLALLICTNNIKGQQTNLFNQNTFQRYTPFNQPKPFTRPQQFQQVSPLLAGQNTFNPRGFTSPNFIPITAYQNEHNYDGSFSYGYSAGDGTTVQAQGYLKNPGVNELEAQVITGSYSYTSPDGTPIRVNYIADENGFRAEGDHIPTPPPIPDAIAKSLQYYGGNRPFNPNLNTNLNPNLNPNIAPNINSFQLPQQQFQQQHRLNQLTPLQLQQQQQQQQQQILQQSGQYQPQLPLAQQRQFPLGGNNQLLIKNQQQQQQQLQQQDQQQQQQQQLQQNQQNQQQLLTQQLLGRPNQISNQFGGFNKFGRYKKETKKNSKKVEIKKKTF